MAQDFEVGPDGLHSPTFPEARALVAARWVERFGEVDTSSESVDGQLIDIIAIALDLLWQGNAQVWADGFFTTAQSVALDLIVDIVGQQRLGPRETITIETLYGTSLSNIPADTILEVPDSGFRFSTDELAQIGDVLGSEVWAVRVLASEDSITYTITVDGTPHDYVSGVGDPLDVIAVGLRDAVNAGSDATAIVAGNDPDDQPVIVLSVTSIPGVVAVSDTGAGGNLDRFPAVRVGVTALETGPQLAPQGALNTIVSPIGGLVGVTNEADAVAGRDRESDGDLRFRHKRDLFGRNTTNKDAMAAALRATEIEGQPAALEVLVLDKTPPKSFTPVVRLNPGLDSGDALQALGDTIWETGPIGIESTGSTQVTVIDAEGKAQQVGLEVATVLYLHLEITITKDPEQWPTTGDPLTTIRDAVASYFGLGGVGELGIDDDFWRAQAVAPAVVAVPGIAIMVTRTDTTPLPGDAPVFADADVAVSSLETLDVSAARITMILAP